MGSHRQPVRAPAAAGRRWLAARAIVWDNLAPVISGSNRGGQRRMAKNRAVAVAGAVALLGLGGLAMAAAAVAVGASTVAHGGRHTPVRRRPGGWRSYRDVTGWHLRYPVTFHIEISEQELQLSIIEVTIATFRPQPGIIVRTDPGGGNVRAVPPLNQASRFPTDGVALRVVTNQAALTDPKPQTPPPRRLTLGGFQPSRGRPSSLLVNATTGETLRAGIYHGTPRSLTQRVYAAGNDYTVVVWIGPDASAQERHTLASIVASLRFPRAPGTL